MENQLTLADTNASAENFSISTKVLNRVGLFLNQNKKLFFCPVFIISKRIDAD